MNSPIDINFPGVVLVAQGFERVLSVGLGGAFDSMG